MNCNMGKSKSDFYIFCYFICKKWKCFIFAISIKNEGVNSALCLAHVTLIDLVISTERLIK